MFAAVTDHVFVDEGHTIDFTNKAFEALEYLDTGVGRHGAPDARRPDRAGAAFRGVLRVATPARPRRARRHDHRRAPRRLRRGRRDRRADRRRRCRRARVALPRRRPARGRRRAARHRCAPASTTSNSVGRSRTRPRSASPASTSRTTTRDWNTVHHSFTAANALHHALQRNPTPALRRGCVHAALRVYLDRFLNVPAARPPRATTGDLGHTRAVLRDAGRRRRRGQRGLRLPARRRLARGGDRRARPRAARRGRGVPLVPDRRGRHPPSRAVAGVVRGVRARARRRRALPRRAHADASGTPDGRAHRDAPAPRRGAVRRRNRTRARTR